MVQVNSRSIPRIIFKIVCSKVTIGLLTILFIFACENSTVRSKSLELISDPIAQDSIFKNLTSLAENSIPENELNDSLAFLILPLEASCPSCRKKTIDSIAKYSNNLLEKHYIILSASSGIKIMRSYFLEEKVELPVLRNKLFLDSFNLASKYDLFKDNPAMYYTADGKAYKKIAAIPATIREDLREFFSGKRK
jgi:hypothetical protein